MKLKDLKNRLASLGSDKDELPVRVMQEHDIGFRESGGIIQFETDLTDVATSSRAIIIIGQELLLPEGELRLEHK
jgi:hypothetical protein